MLKIIFAVVIAVIGYMIYTGNMGGAKKATGNYMEVMHSGKGSGSGKPAPMYQYIKNKEKGSIK